MKIVEARAIAYPALVSLLRQMKRQFEGLSLATNGRTGGPIDLAKKTERARLVRLALAELAELDKEFDDLLSKNRLFTKRSDYALQLYTRHFCSEWSNKSGLFSISESQLASVIEAYNDDVSFLVDEFYRPTKPRWTGSMLGHAATMRVPDGKIAGRFSQQPKDKGQLDEDGYINMLIERRPRSDAPASHEAASETPGGGPAPTTR